MYVINVNGKLVTHVENILHTMQGSKYSNNNCGYRLQWVCQAAAISDGGTEIKWTVVAVSVVTSNIC